MRRALTRHPRSIVRKRTPFAGEQSSCSPGSWQFSAGLNAPFVFDDHESIVRNPYVGQFWPIDAAPQSAVAGRPAVALSLAISHAMAGLNPAVFRAWNLAVHITAALLLFAVLRRTLTIKPGSTRSPSSPRSSG